MFVPRLACVVCAALVAVPLAAQQQDSIARAKARADSVAHADSARRADSIRAANDLDRIRHEPRKFDTTRVPPPLRLSRAEAILIALANNPTIVVAQEQMAQSGARVTEATAFGDPALAFTVQGFNSPLWPHPAVETDIIAGVTVAMPWKYSQRGTVAEGDLGSFAAAYRLQVQQVRLQTSQAYDSLLVSLKHRDDLLTSSQLAADFLKKTEARYNAGTTARLDVVKAQVSVAQAANSLIANERGVANARSALNRLLGRLLGAGIEATDTLAILAVPDDFPRLEQVAMQRRPELYSIQKQIAAANAQHSLAQQYLLPDLNVAVQYNFPYGFPTSWTTGVGVSVPLLFWQHQNGEVAEAAHHQRELAAAQRDAFAQVQQDLRTSYANAVTAYRQAVFIRDELLPSAQEQYQISFTSYSLGGSSALEVIDAQSTLLDAKDQFATALGALNDALADVERAVGAPLDTQPTATHD